MIYWFFLVLPFLILSTPIFAQAPESSTYHNSFEYVLQIDQHTYTIHYVVNSDVIAMAIDPESKSLLIGLEKTHDSQFIIGLEHELISAPNNEFVILVDGKEVYYKITSDSNISTFEFFVPSGSEEVEIIGTNVIPEFPTSAVFVLVVMVLSVIIFAKIKTPFLSCNLI